MTNQSNTNTKTVHIPTRAEVEDLKSQWLADPIWDIEHTEEFEPHREELEKFRRYHEDKWEKERSLRLLEESKKYGCSPQMCKYIQRLESAVNSLDSRVEALSAQVSTLQHELSQL